MSRPTNLIFFLTDNHARDFMSASGHPVVKTPNLDRIASNGVRFANAYCATTLCCPSRAAIATGRYPHQTGYWDNATMYDGAIPTWHHRLREAGTSVTVIGKLHFRSAEDDNGFTEEINTMHVVGGIGSPLTLLRGSEEGVPSRSGHKAIYADAGPGQSDYQIYDSEITEHAIAWLRQNVDRQDPWVLIVSYPSPHPPFRIPQEIWDMYPPEAMPLPPTWNAPNRYDHPAMAYLAQMNQLSDGMEEDVVRRAYAGYCGLITNTDANIGKVMDEAEQLGLMDRTGLLYTSDHGEAISAHGILGKANLYEHATAVPLLICGPGLPEGEIVEHTASHIDIFPTMLDLFEVPAKADQEDVTGRSLLPLLRHEGEARPLFAEYHAMGCKNSCFMMRIGDFKLIYHVDMPNQLFDLATDPWEQHDLLANGASHPKAAELVAALRSMVNPEELDARSKADQRDRIDALGGIEKVRRMGSFAASPIPGKAVKLD